MSAVWDIEDIDSSECLVLIALADHADDMGRCYPSIGRLAKRTKLSDRGVQKVISRLIEKGFVTVTPCAGQGGANLYTVTATPEPRSPLNDVHPRTEFTTPPNHVRETPEPRSPKPSRTTIEPSEDITARKRLKVRIPENWHPGDEGIAYALDKNIPMEVIRDEIDGFRAYWLDRTDAQGRKSCEGWKQCWQNRVRTIAGRYATRQPARGNHRPASAVHSSDRQIAFAARAVRTPSSDCI